MNNIRYYPVILYSIILLGIWLLSWLAGVYELIAYDVVRVDNLISAEGVRWALRTAHSSISSAPWAIVMLVLVSYGFVSSSGFLNSLQDILRFRRLPVNKQRAFIMAVITFLVCFAILCLAVFSPIRILQGITSQFYSSPLLKGWDMLLLVVSISVSVVYGLLSGSYHDFYDVMSGVCNSVSIFIPAFVAFIPASGILPCLEYVGFVPENSSLLFYEILLYVIPLLLCVFIYSEKRN